MMEKGYIHTEQLWAETYPTQLMGGMFTVTDHWASLWIYAAVGVMLIAVALLMYRKRHLETAGDFIAVKPLRPVFLVIYTLCAGVAFFVFQELFLGGPLTYFWLYIGLAVGFFTGLMLLERTVRVFRKKHFALCGVLMLIFSLTLVATALDIFGIESWMPEKSEVKSVTICDNHIFYVNNYDGPDGVVLEGEDIEIGLRLHELALENRELDDTIIGNDYVVVDYLDTVETRFAASFTIIYELTDGSKVTRYYYGFADSESGKILTDLFSTPEQVLGVEESEIPGFAANIEEILLDSEFVTPALDEQQRQALLEAIAADCRDGNMAQNWAFHSVDNVEYYLEFQYWNAEARNSDWMTITVFPECRHTIAFIEESGMLDYEPPVYGPLG
jgi:ABC-2 type transport system permease protein